MRTTASYDLFPDAPSERAMARARWLVREGRVSDAESAYRDVLASHPDLKPCWAEYFELLRSHGRPAEALRIGEAARAHFADSAFALALTGAALIELDRLPEALAMLERAVEADPDLGMVWHELGYAAYRMRDRNRALMALDRAFALEPHTETLKLRGLVLRDAGRFAAAEVAFEGAAQAAEHDEQRALAEREILVTRRYASYAPRRPEDLTPAQRWFAATGSVILAPLPGPIPPGDEALVTAMAELAEDAGWRFGQVVALGPTLGIWSALAERLGVPLAARGSFDPFAVPLLVALRPLSADTGWGELASQVAQTARGLVFTLEHPVEADLPSVGVDLAGVLTTGGRREAAMPSVAHALSETQVPAARLGGRRLHHE